MSSFMELSQRLYILKKKNLKIFVFARLVNLVQIGTKNNSYGFDGVGAKDLKPKDLKDI